MEIIERNLVYIIIFLVIAVLVILISKNKKMNMQKRMEVVSNDSYMDAPNKKVKKYNSSKKGSIFDQVPNQIAVEKKSNWTTTTSYDDDINNIDLLSETKDDSDLSVGILSIVKEQDDRIGSYKKQILLVDDSLVVRKYVGDLLKKNHYDVITKNDGGEAMTYLSNTDMLPDLMISDIEMPIMDGIELIDKIRNHHQYNSMPVIIISAHAENHVRLMEEEKIQGFTKKPFNDEDLISQINYLVEH